MLEIKRRGREAHNCADRHTERDGKSVKSLLLLVLSAAAVPIDGMEDGKPLPSFPPLLSSWVIYHQSVGPKGDRDATFITQSNVRARATMSLEKVKERSFLP